MTERRLIPIEPALRKICQTITAAVEAGGGGSLIESDDLYQADHYVGGWTPDGDDGPGFYFSYQAPDGGDFIFMITIDTARSIASGNSPEIDGTYWKCSPIGPY